MTGTTIVSPQDNAPEGVTCPAADTLVLMTRELRPGSDLARLSRFADDRWHVDPAIFEDHAQASSFNFVRVPAPLRLTAKCYVWQLLNYTGPKVMRHAQGGRLSVASVQHTFAGLKQFLNWLDRRGVTALSSVTPQLLDDYLADLADEEIDLELKYRRLTEVRRLWANRDLLPASMRLPAAPPWDGEDSRDLFGRARINGDNRTRRIPERTMQPLLMWSLRFVEDFADDIMAAHSQFLELRDNGPGQRRRNGHNARPSHGEVTRRMRAYLKRLHRDGGSLPGKRQEDGTLAIDWNHIGRAVICSASVQTSLAGRMAAESGLPVADDAYLDTPVTGTLDGSAWREQIGYHEAKQLARLLSTACFLTIAYLSGARPGEVLNLRRGCVTYAPDTKLWLMHGRYFKNAVDQDGNKMPEGELRRDPWVVVEAVARAVAVLERLHPGPLLFPTRIEPYPQSAPTRRQGHARPDKRIAVDIANFVRWVNEECRTQGRNDGIPADDLGVLAASRLRRTLAWFIRRRPRGLVAASIQYGHLQTRLLQGYAGTYESGFPDEYAFEDWLFRIESLAEDEEALEAGEHVSGPAAAAYRQRVTAANRQFAGHVLTSDRQARDLVGNPLLQIHHGEGMTCVLDPAQAACQLRGTEGDPLVTPDTDDCRPKCRNIARTDRDILQIRTRHRELTEITTDVLAPGIRHARETNERDRLAAVLGDHDHGRPEHRA
ncbi:hypothetical protein AB0C89_36300 [Streptomyces sp. NPDC048491]|uniref:hypothetical protein n=1 Tax=Streptomyces sp. NPDC048491 TaxID=3157207 RepID=UPI003445F362